MKHIRKCLPLLLVAAMVLGGAGCLPDRENSNHDMP
jgi:hypothetical protein